MKGVKKRPQIELAQRQVTVSAYLCSSRVFCNLLRDLHMLTVFGSRGNILLITRNVVFRRNQAEKSLERGVVSFERFQQFCGRDHFCFDGGAEERSVASAI